MWMLEVGETSHAGCLEVEGVCVGGNLLQFRQEAINFLNRHGRSEKFQRQMKIRRRHPFDAVIVRAQLRNEILDRALDLRVDANRDEGANLIANHPEAELPQRNGDTENRKNGAAA